MALKSANFKFTNEKFMIISDINQLDLNKKYTYTDYLNWRFDEMVELIRGKVYKMSPAPAPYHQYISAELIYLIKHYLRKKGCQAYHAPFDVRLPLPDEYQKDGKISTVVQPDIFVVCDVSKIDHQGCNGAPDWVIEILSKSTAKKDLIEKFEVYQHSGVKEYWIIHPDERTLLAYYLNQDGQYELQRKNPFVEGESVSVKTFEGFAINLGEVFN